MPYCHDLASLYISHFCPSVFASEEFAEVCNVRPGDRQRPYGHDALVATPNHDYEVNPEPSEHQGAVAFYETKERECLVFPVSFYNRLNAAERRISY